MIVVGTLVLAGVPVKQSAAQDIIEPKIVITQLKLGGGEASGNPPTKEFVTLYNAGDASLSLTDWLLEYAKAGTPVACEGDAGWRVTQLAGQLAPGQVVSLDYQMNDDTAGALRVRQTTADMIITHDLVGWGEQAPCHQGQPAAVPPAGKSLQRYLGCDGTRPVVTQNNAADFVVSDAPLYGVLDGSLLPECTAADEPVPPEETPLCQGVVITEILPNPAATDTGKEFIELYNPTSQAIALEGCALQTSANDTVFQIGNITLQPGHYRAWYSSSTGLVLPNSGGGTVWLLSTTQEVQAIAYGGGLADDVAWAVTPGGQWQETYTPTPNAHNIITSHKPCPAGQERSIDTGHCRSVITATVASGPAPCRPGQQRNPQTNRCRATAEAASALQPCAPNQYRNPQTNRCKKIEDDEQGLKPCQQGYDRNPQTNRCRKVTSAAGIGTIYDIPPAAGGNTVGWWLAGAGIMGALGYGVYEWRHEIGRLLASIKNKFVPAGTADEG